MTGFSVFDTARAIMREQLCRLLSGEEEDTKSRCLYKMLRELDNARLAGGQYGTARVCNINELLEGLCIALAILLAARGRSLYASLPKVQIYAQLDPDALSAAACNLITNAFERTGAQSVRLRLTSASGNAVITVSDSEQGAAVASMLGLGMPAVKRICEAFGGNLKTATGSGTSVTITLPVCDRPDPKTRYRAPGYLEQIIDRFSRVCVAVRALEDI